MHISAPIATKITPVHRPFGRFKHYWAIASIRTKILAPLVIFMAIALLISLIGFSISTSTTRDSLLEQQLTEDIQRVSAAFQQREDELFESATLLAGDPELVQALQADQIQSDTTPILDLDRRALLVRDRFRLDQVIVVNSQGEPQVNIAAQSYLSQIDESTRQQLLQGTRDTQIVLAQNGSSWLLIGSATITGVDSLALGQVYTFLNIPEELRRIRRDLELRAEVQIATDMPLAATLPELADENLAASRIQIAGSNFTIRATDLVLGGQTVQLALLRNQDELDAIIGAGVEVILIGAGFTLLLLLAVGIWVTQSITRPILKLSTVARAIAAGDLSKRANLLYSDEIGQLGNAFDHATMTITGLLEQQARNAGELNAILHGITDGVLAVDNQEQIVLVNPAATALLHQSNTLLIGRPLQILMQHDDPAIAVGAEQIVNQIHNTLHSTDTMPSEERIALGRRIISFESGLTFGSDGMPTGAVVVLNDITRVVEAERAKNEFIGTASHELRTPLTGLKGFVDLLYIDGVDNLSDLQRQALETIRRQTDNLTVLVNDLLEVARIEQDTLRVDRRWVALPSAISDAIAGLGAQIKARRISLVMSISPGLPKVMVDELHLRRILVNLFSNAVKYIDDEGKITIRATMCETVTFPPHTVFGLPWEHHEQRSVMIEVEDNGVGIRAADQPKIFTRFFRSENRLSIHAGGTGLGLAIAQALTQLHNGQIGFWSLEHQGSCFWLRLPVPLTDPMEEAEAAY